MRTPCRPPLGERRRTAPNSPWRRWDGACGGSVQAELVALRVGHHDGARRERRGGIVALEPGRAMRTKPFGLRVQGRHPRVALQPQIARAAWRENERETDAAGTFTQGSTP